MVNVNNNMGNVNSNVEQLAENNNNNNIIILNNNARAPNPIEHTVESIRAAAMGGHVEAGHYQALAQHLPPNCTDITGALRGEPFNLPPSQIGQLDHNQLRQLINERGALQAKKEALGACMDKVNNAMANQGLESEKFKSAVKELNRLAMQQNCSTELLDEVIANKTPNDERTRQVVHAMLNTIREEAAAQKREDVINSPAFQQIAPHASECITLQNAIDKEYYKLYDFEEGSPGYIQKRQEIQDLQNLLVEAKKRLCIALNDAKMSPATMETMLVEAGFSEENIAKLDGDRNLQANMDKIKTDAKIANIPPNELTKIKNEITSFLDENELSFERQGNHGKSLAKLMEKHHLTIEDLKAIDDNEELNNPVEMGFLQQLLTAQLRKDERNEAILDGVKDLNDAGENPALRQAALDKIAAAMNNRGWLSHRDKMGVEDVEFLLKQAGVEIPERPDGKNFLEGLAEAQQTNKTERKEQSDEKWSGRLKMLGIVAAVGAIAIGVIAGLAVSAAGLALCFGPTAPLGVAMIFVGIAIAAGSVAVGGIIIPMGIAENKATRAREDAEAQTERDQARRGNTPAPASTPPNPVHDDDDENPPHVDNNGGGDNPNLNNNNNNRPYANLSTEELNENIRRLQEPKVGANGDELENQDDIIALRQYEEELRRRQNPQ